MGLNRRAPDRLFFALGGNGIASGEVGAQFPTKGTGAVEARCCGDRGEGESGVFGEDEVDFEVTSRKVGPFDGERESDRRSCASAFDGLTVWM